MKIQKSKPLPSFPSLTFPSLPPQVFLPSPQIEKLDLLIKPSFDTHLTDNIDFSSYLSFIDQAIRKIFPASFLNEIKRKNLKDLLQLLPLVSWNMPEHVPCLFSFSLLCPADFTQKVGRYVFDSISKKLIPGKILTISSAQSLNFQFVDFPERDFFFHQALLMIDDEKELSLAAENLPQFAHELKLNISAIEFEKENSQPLTSLRELKMGIENIIHPVFMPRNEEEVMRNILSLSQQLKYVKDIPQVVISFEAQTEKDLSFTIILLRLLRGHELPIHDIFQQARSHFLFYGYECKHVGYIRKKYIKEANVFKVKLEKKPFLRKDYSLDLFKARQAVFTELVNMLGEIRDFNGGILSKQHEIFHALKEELSTINPSQDFLLENFFYSITPSLMQNLLPLSALKTLFLLLFEVIEDDPEGLFFKSKQQGDYFFAVSCSPCTSFKDVSSLVHHLPFAPPDLTYTSVNIYEISCIGYLFRCEDINQAHAFLHSLEEYLRESSSL